MYLLVSCVGGFFCGTQAAIGYETYAGGKHKIEPFKEMPSSFFVLIRDSITGEISAKNVGKYEFNRVIEKVKNVSYMTFLLNNTSGSFGSGEAHDISGKYHVENLGKHRQRILIDWTENDDMSGSSAYTVENDTVLPERWGFVHPGFMGLGIYLGIGLPLFGLAVGWQLKYTTEKKGNPFLHYLLVSLVGIPGSAYLFFFISFFIG